MQKPALKLSLLSLLVGFSLNPAAYAAIVRGDVDYQYFRDLAENKGKFAVNATDIPVVGKNGNDLGLFLRVTPSKTVEVEAPPPKKPADMFACFSNNPPADCDDFLNGGSQPKTETITLDPVSIPMIDFSPLTRKSGFATLIDPQYLVSVNHNQGYFHVQFGDSSSEKPDDHHYDYNIVRRNNYMPDPSKLRNDQANNPNGEARERNDVGEKIIRTPDGSPTDRWDYHAPRLAKLVTEVAPANELEAPASGEERYNFYENFGDRTLFPLFIRAGSGRQATVKATTDTMATRTEVGGGQFLIGGTVLPVLPVDESAGGVGLGKILVATSDGTTNDVFRDHGYGPLTTLGLPGDSGSAIFGYDLTNKRWVLLGVYSDYFTANPVNEPGGNVVKSYWNYHHPHYVRALEKENTAGNITTSGATLTWTPNNNTSTIAGSGELLTVKLADSNLTAHTGHNGNKDDNPWNPQLHHGQTFHITGSGNTIRLTDNINQGAGAIHITGDTTFEGAKDGITWLGAGLDIDKGSTVTWKIGNPAGDRLSKIGEGTLIINGKGTNAGSISVGDGTVILNQQAGENSPKSAFSELGIVSGRPTVILNSADQMDANNIYFGYRGGRLDLNGNSLSFKRIQNSDDGARIVNHNGNQASTVTITGRDDTLPTAPTLKTGEMRIQNFSLLNTISDARNPNTDIFTYKHNAQAVTNYFVPKNANAYNQRSFPIQNDFPHRTGRENEFFYYFDNLEAAQAQAAKNRETAYQAALAEYNTTVATLENTVHGYNGYFGENADGKTNGELNVRFKPTIKNNTLMLSGGTHLNGTLSVEDNGQLVLTGRPVPHAYNHQEKKEVIKDGEWINREFHATTFAAQGNSKLEVSRNVSAVNGNFSLSDNATAQIGYTDGKSQVCIRSDRTGNAGCEATTLSAADLNSWDRTVVTGNAQLADNAQFTLGSKATMTGSVNGEKTTVLALDNGSVLNLNGTSTTGKTEGEAGSTVNLNGVWTTVNHTVLDVLNLTNSTINLNTDSADTPNQLTANTLSGNGTFKFFADLAKTVSDSVIINGIASGQFITEISKIGESASLARIKLFETNGENNFSLSLANEVTSGEYRYTLEKEGLAYYLKPEKVEEKPLPPITPPALPKATPPVTPSETPKATPSGVPTATPSETPKATPSETPKATPSETPKATPSETPKATPSETPKATPSEMPKATPSEMPKATPSEMPKAMPSETPKTTPPETPTATPSETPTTTPSETPKTTPSETPKATPSETPKTTPSETPKATPSETPKATPSETPKATPPQMPKADSVENAFFHELTAQTHAFLGLTHELDHRVRETETENWAVWSHTEQKSTDYRSAGRGFEQKALQTQIGVEKALPNNTLVGATLSHSKANNQFDSNASGKGDITMLSLYAKKSWENGAFIAADGSFGQANNRVNYLGHQAKFKRDLLAVGVNVGKAWEVSGVNLTPTLGVRYHHLSAAHYGQVKTQSVDLLSYQIGISLDKTFEINGIRVKPEIGSYMVNTESSLKTRVNDLHFTQQIGHAFKQEAGISAQYGNLSAGLHMGFLTGNRADKQRFAAFKFGYQW